MANFNKVILAGNLTRDPQFKVIPSSQMPVADFGLAVNHKYTTKSGESRDEVLFIDCSIFGKGAEIINKFCRKGKPLLIEGRLKLETWEDKQGGGKRSKHTIVVDNFQFLGGRDDQAGGGGGGNYDAGSAPAGGDEFDQRPAPARAPQRAAPPRQAPVEPPFGDEQQINEDDIPF